MERGATLTLMSLCSYTVATTEIAIFSVRVPCCSSWFRYLVRGLMSSGFWSNGLVWDSNTTARLALNTLEILNDSNSFWTIFQRGHYMVVRGNSKQETERWYQALLTHVNHSGRDNYVQPSPMTRDPSLLKPVIIIDLGSSSVRAGILSSQGKLILNNCCWRLHQLCSCSHVVATLPQVFFPSAVAVDKISGSNIAFGMQSLLPEIRMKSTLTYPIRSSNKISKVNHWIVRRVKLRNNTLFH